MQPEAERREPCPQCDSESSRCTCIPRWLVVQTAADIEEVMRAASAQRTKLRSREFAPLRHALKKLSQDARYGREIATGRVRRTRRI